MIRAFAQLHLENQIEQAFQSRAIAITTNPYQGLKLPLGLGLPATLPLIAITTNPYQGLKLVAWE